MEISPGVFARAKKLKRPAVDELFAEVYPAVVRIARGLSGREDVAEGVVRFIMLRAARMIPTWRDETAAERWFLHHTVLTTRRAAAHQPAAQSDLLVGSGGGPSEPAYTAFVRAVRQLPVQQREAFLLHAGEHFNNRYLGVAMDCSTGAAQAHLDAAAAALRAVTAAGEFDPLVARISAAYAHLGPNQPEVFPAVGRWVTRGLRPQRIRRTIRLAIVLAILCGIGWTVWHWRLWRITGILHAPTTQPSPATQR
ncbi:MAG TPA: RNA polymerase sigma factor [Tepidisphaeraceae bacterium]|jgi:DNA-directed RNA polymerase specialized sigma24 family protein